MKTKNPPKTSISNKNEPPEQSAAAAEISDLNHIIDCLKSDNEKLRRKLQEKQTLAATLRERAAALANDISAVCSKAGKHPGSMVAYQHQLQDLARLNHPLLDQEV